MLGDEIRLSLPAEPAYGRIARIAAAGLALRLGLDHTEVEDLRIAVDEALILLLRPDGGDRGDHDLDGTETPITLTFTVGFDRLLVDASIEPDHAGTSPDEHARARFAEIVGATVDEYAIDNDGLHVHLEKVRYRPASSCAG